MTPRGDSAALRWLMGTVLRECRVTARATLAQAAGAITGSVSKVSNMESGRYYQAPHDVRALLKLYAVESDRLEHLVQLAAGEDERPWWSSWQDVMPDWLRLFVGLEGCATSLFTYEPLVIPALLQTRGYAAATTESPRVRRDDVDQVVGLRMERQRRLHDSDDLQLHAVVEEATLHRPVGTTETMKAQLQHLVAVTAQPNVTVQVLPTDVGVHAAFTGKFDLLRFESFEPVVYVELMETAVYLADSQKVRAYKLSAESLHDAALSQHDSLAMITSLVGEH